MGPYRFIAIVLLVFLLVGMFTGDWMMRDNQRQWRWVLFGNVLIVACCGMVLAILRDRRRWLGLTRWQWVAGAAACYAAGAVMGAVLLEIVR